MSGFPRLPPAFAGKPRLPKPCITEALEAALKRGDDDIAKG